MKSSHAAAGFRSCRNQENFFPDYEGLAMIRRVDPLISIREAERHIVDSCRTLGRETIGLAAALGRVLAEPLLADRPLPPFPRAMMDGVAFNSTVIDVSAPLEIAGLHAAGDPPPRPLRAGEAWEIMTGAAVPDDCDAVVPYEDLADGFSLSSPPEPGQCIHPRGLDAAEGDALVTAGCRIGPAEISIAASVGKTCVEVFRRPRIAIVTTGDEAVAVDATPEPWQIRRSNGPMLEAALARLGFPEIAGFHIPDDPAAAREPIRSALANSDIVILCGGISMGKKDHVRSLLEAHLGAPAFHGVELRPGKPFAYWPGPPLVFALPGNPVSVLATFTRFVLPALLRIQGLSAPAGFRVQVSSATPLPRFSWLLPVAPGPDGSLVPRPPRNSGDYVSIAGTIGIVEIPPEPAFTPGQAFSFFPFP
jgi:molybdopterin molybdotransferase